MKVEFGKLGYTIIHQKMHAEDYGVPQKRRRIFIIGKHKSVNHHYEFPEKITNNPVTVREAIQNLPSLNANDGHDEIMVESIPFTLAGVNGTTNIMTGVTFTGGDSEVYIGLQEDGTEDNDQGEDKIILNQTHTSGTDANEGILAEDSTSDIAVYTQVGSSSNSAQILNGVTVAAS